MKFDIASLFGIMLGIVTTGTVCPIGIDDSGPEPVTSFQY